MSKIRVSIAVAEVVKSHRYVEMEEADFLRIDAALGSDDHKIRRRAEEEVSLYIRPEDANDWEDVEVNVFEKLKA